MKTTTVKSTFKVHEVVVLSGFTKHMLDYLARDGIFKPSDEQSGIKGRRRQYTYEDVVLLRALHTICAGRGQIRHLKEALAALRKEIGPIKPGQRLDKLLFVEGNELCLRTSADGGRQLRTGQMSFAFVVDLRAVSIDLATCMEPSGRAGMHRLKPRVASQAEAVRLEAWEPIRKRREASNS